MNKADRHFDESFCRDIKLNLACSKEGIGLDYELEKSITEGKVVECMNKLKCGKAAGTVGERNISVWWTGSSSIGLETVQ